MRKKVLVSGVGYSQGGVGRLMEKLSPEAKLRGYIVLSRRMVLILQLVRQKRYIKLSYELILRLLSLIFFKIKTFFVKGDLVLVLYPQGIGYKTFIRLIKNNAVYFYVIDNSFFCMMSYNYNKETDSECFNCVANPHKSMKSCYSWPARIRKKAAVNYLDALMNYSEKIVFLVQTQLQQKLLKEHFGSKVDCRIVGMEPADLSLDMILSLDSTIVVTRKYDLVYHGSSHLAKGFLYFLRLSALLPHLKIFIPTSRKTATSLVDDGTTLDHITFKDCTWETGLKEAVTKAKLVVNPSLWSSPVEGAFLKSLAYNGNVAVVESKFGFPQVLVDKDIILNLSNNPVDTVNVIENYLNSGVNNHEKAKVWLIDFYKTNKTQNVFNSIELSA